MSKIEFDAEQTARIVTLIQSYFSSKLDSDIGRFDAEFLLDFIGSEIGVFYYNQAITDAHKLLQGQIDLMSENLLELEKWSPPNR